MTTDAATTDAATTDSQPTFTGQWYEWELRTFDISVTGDGTVNEQSHTVTVSTLGGNGPNIDAVAVHDVGDAGQLFRPHSRD